MCCVGNRSARCSCKRNIFGFYQGHFSVQHCEWAPINKSIRIHTRADLLVYWLIYVCNCARACVQSVYFGAQFVLPEVGWGFDPTSNPFVTCPRHLGQTFLGRHWPSPLFLSFNHSFSPCVCLDVVMLINPTLFIQSLLDNALKKLTILLVKSF